MLDELDDLSAGVDSITRIAWFLHSLRYLFMVRTIHIPGDIRDKRGYVPQGWTLGDITDVLSRAGIDNWGHQVFSDAAQLTVARRDYYRAIHLIQQTVMNPRHKGPRHTPFSFVRQVFSDRLAWLICLLAVAFVLGALFLPR